MTLPQKTLSPYCHILFERFDENEKTYKIESSLKVNGTQATRLVFVVPNGVPNGSVRVKSNSIVQPDSFGMRNLR